ncbi:MAG TPA: hypothetical protein VNL91_07170 [Thermoanaerobaculia bacterium]|nr:hypothetical protein [Thermoanaerobaculia bacterium]
MIFVTMPMMVSALVPVIAIEALILTRRLRSPFWATTACASLSNLLSTLIGIPLTWSLLAGIQLLTGGGRAYDALNTLRGRLLAVTWQAPWLIPYESELHWMIPFAILVLLVPFFFASYAIESAVHTRFLVSQTSATVGQATFLANLVSYLGLGAYTGIVWVMPGSFASVPLAAIDWLRAAFLFVAPALIATHRYRSRWRGLVIGFTSLVGFSFGSALVAAAGRLNQSFPWFLLIPSGVVLGCAVGIAIPVLWFARSDRAHVTPALAEASAPPERNRA